MEKVISYLTEKPINAKEYEEIQSKTITAIDETLNLGQYLKAEITNNTTTNFKIPSEMDENNLSYDQSLEYLSLSIQNRLKVEADQNTDCQNNNVLLERLSKVNSLVNELNLQKIEE